MGLVTKYAGSVRKGFALIFGIIITVAVQGITGKEEVKWNQFLGTLIVVLAMYLHANFGSAYRIVEKVTTQRKQATVKIKGKDVLKPKTKKSKKAD